MFNTSIINPLWDSFIEQEYQKYKIFVNDSNMPSYKTNYINGNEINVPYTMQTDTSCNPMILNVNTIYMDNEKYKHCQPTLYHEFTHMWDDKNIFVNKEPVDRNKFLSFYTEYHASQIEFIRFIEADSISNINSVEPMDEFYVFNEKISVVKYFLNVCRLLFEKSCKYKSEKTIGNYKFLMDAYMYVFGIKSIYDKVIGEIKLPEINDIFYTYMLSIYSLLQNNNVNELWTPLLEKIDDLDIMCAKDIMSI